MSELMRKIRATEYWTLKILWESGKFLLFLVVFVIAWAIGIAVMIVMFLSFFGSGGY